MATSNSLLIIGQDHREIQGGIQIDIGPHAMLVQTPLGNLKTEEIGYFRVPEEQSFTWKRVFYSSFAILHDMVFMMGSAYDAHQQDILVIRNCGFEVYRINGKPVKFTEPTRIRGAVTYSYQGIFFISPDRVQA